MTLPIDDVIAKLKADLEYRTPGLDKPLGHIVLYRAEAAVALEWMQMVKANHRCLYEIDKSGLIDTCKICGDERA